MSQWARNNPEKVGTDPRTHVPGYGSPANHSDRWNPSDPYPDEPGPIELTAEQKAAGAAALAENDKQAAELDRYIEHKDEMMRALAGAIEWAEHPSRPTYVRLEAALWRKLLRVIREGA